MVADMIVRQLAFVVVLVALIVSAHAVAPRLFTALSAPDPIVTVKE